jgi:predicted nucleotidyltransferase
MRKKYLDIRKRYNKFDRICQNEKCQNMDTFGEKIRKFREEKGLPLRVVTAFLDIDQAILSKIERGIRKASREQVVKLAGYFNANEEDLLVSWLSDKLVYASEDDELTLKALQMAEEKITYKKFIRLDKNEIIKTIQDYLSLDGRVKRAMIFGSFARGDDGPGSDIDMVIEVADTSKFTYFDLGDIQFYLEKLLKRKIDLGFYDSIRPTIFERIKNELEVIYER